LKEHGVWRTALRLVDPIDVLVECRKGRIETLLPIRYGPAD
jgi:hypothetical protein